MTINQLIYNIRKQIKDSGSDDLKLSDRNIEFMINYLREKLIVQNLSKGRSISSNIKQDLGQIALVRVDRNDGILPTSTTILRTSVRIPQPIELNQGDLITYIGGLDKMSPIAFKTKSYASKLKNLKYSSKEPVAFLSDGYVYITNCPTYSSIKWINIEGVWLNPRDVHKFKNPNGTPCYNPDVDNYPISGKMVDTINDLIKTKELNLLYQIAEDTTNDAQAN